MLLQMLQAQGMSVDWYEQLPNDAPGEAARGTNEGGAQYIKKIGKRPGQRLKKIEERICAAPANAAIKRRGGLPKATFPELATLSKQRRKREFTSRGMQLVAHGGGPNPMTIPYWVAVGPTINVLEAGATVDAGGVAVPLVQPTFLLPGVLQMPEAQQKQREPKAPARAPGAPKWTKVRQAHALEEIKNGREPPALPKNPKYQRVS